MKGLRKISPVEFRLSSKLFNLAVSPSNYYEKFKYEVLLQKILYVYYKRHGTLFFIQNFLERTNYIILQFYFYRAVPFLKLKRPRYLTNLAL